MEELNELREIIVSRFSSAWELNDAAHRIKHFREVELCGYHLNEVLGLGYDPKLILFVAYFHDMFAWSRANHHELSGSFVRGTCHAVLSSLTDEERLLVAQGCEEHRASFKGEFSSGFSALMNSADRGFPTDVGAMLERAIQYRMARGHGRDESMQPAIDHIKEKFGAGGYARYPDLYKQAFEGQLTEMQETIHLL